MPSVTIRKEVVMLTTKLIGALFVVCGLLYMAATAVYRGRMSEPHSSNGESAGLEPRHRGLRFLGLKANWPGLLVAAIGAVMLLVPSV
jgi:hypothetical protein